MSRPCHESLRAHIAAEKSAMAERGYITADEAAVRANRGLATIYRWLRDARVDGLLWGTSPCRWVSVQSLDLLVARISAPPAAPMIRGATVGPANNVTTNNEPARREP